MWARASRSIFAQVGRQEDQRFKGQKVGGTAVEGATPLGYVEGTSFPGTFEHIASGYAAGYYGYMWAKVIALDMVSIFGADVMNGEKGRRFRELILSRGSEEPAKDLVERFLGRPVSSEAFFARIQGG